MRIHIRYLRAIYLQPAWYKRTLESQNFVGFHHQVDEIGRADETSVNAFEIIFCDPTGHAARQSQIEGNVLSDHFVEKLLERWKTNTMD